MTKYLVVALVIAIVIWLTRKGKRAEQVKAANARRREIRHDTMVQCEQCGIHLPRSEAFLSRGRIFCSEAHRAAFERVSS